MLTNNTVGVYSLLYPLSDTPVISLTRDLSEEQNADILLLGCGDACNILFTCFDDEECKLDVTCCDIQAMILARNIMLFTLLADDKAEDKITLIWIIYYHWQLEPDSFALLQKQTSQLLRCSETLDDWRQSPYGSFIKFCDVQTLSRVRDCWKEFQLTEVSPISKQNKQASFQANKELALKLRQIRIDDQQDPSAFEHFYLTSEYLQPLRIDFGKIDQIWWERGLLVSETESTTINGLELNPMFLASPHQNLILHYGISPLASFPIVDDLLSDWRRYFADSNNSNVTWIISRAQANFAKWGKSFRQSVENGTVVRFFNGDALAFALTLEKATSAAGQQPLTANLYCSSWSADPLILDTKEYVGTPKAAPRTFDVIDTSDLVDHVGFISIISVCAGILKSTLASILYTETRRLNYFLTFLKGLESLLGCDLRLMLLLFGIYPVRLDHYALDIRDPEAFDVLPRGSFKEQPRKRLSWKKGNDDSIDSIDGQTNRVVIDAKELASVFIHIYDRMFRQELTNSRIKDMIRDAPDSKLHGGWKRYGLDPYYSRVIFLALFNLARIRVETDWNKCMAAIGAQLTESFQTEEGKNGNVPMCGMHENELTAYMSLFKNIDICNQGMDIFTSNATLKTIFSKWRDIPAHICVTVRVPRKAIRQITNLAVEESTLTNMSFLCSLQDFATRRMDNYQALQIMFGQPELRKDCGKPSLLIHEDLDRWTGESDMFVSFIMLTGTFMMHEHMDHLLCRILPTPFSVTKFEKELGSDLTYFETKLLDPTVFITRNMPGMSGLPLLSRRTPASPSRADSKRSRLTLRLDESGTKPKSITRRLKLERMIYRDLLADKSCKVTWALKSEFVATVTIAGRHHFDLHFPVAVETAKGRFRVARGSAYIEIEAVVWVWEPESCTFVCKLCARPDGNSNGRRDVPKIRGEKLLICSGCRMARYCSKICQKLDWKDHKKSCVGLPSLLKPMSRKTNSGETELFVVH